MHAQYAQEAKSNGINFIPDREKGQNNQVMALHEWKHTTSIYGV